MIVVRKLIHHQVSESHNDVLVPMFLNGGVLYAVLLGFLVIAVWENYGAAKRARRSSHHPGHRSIPLPTACRRPMPPMSGKGLRTYAEAVVKEEWPSLAASAKGQLQATRRWATCTGTMPRS